MFVRILMAVLVVAAGLLPTATVRAQYYGDDRGYGPGSAIECRSSGYNYSIAVTGPVARSNAAAAATTTRSRLRAR